MSEITIQTPRWFVPLARPARYKGAWGGRGSGKSHAFAEAMIEAHVINPNTSSLCVREIQRSLQQSVKRLLEQKIESLNAGYYFDVQDMRIKSACGDGIIIFAGLQNHTADSIKSLEGFDRAWIEEAQSVSQRSLDLLRPTIRKPGSEIWATWNPRNVTDPIDALLRGPVPPDDAVIVNVSYSDNPWFPDELLAELEYDKLRDPDKYRHVWLGEYIQRSEARVFRNWRVDEFTAPPDAMHRLGLDFGFAADPSAAVRCHTVGRTIYIDHEAYGVSVEVVDLPDFVRQIPGAERWPVIADSSRPETISHLRKHGLPKILGCVKGAGSVSDGVEWLKSHDIVVHPRCRHVIDELTLYRYKSDALTDRVLPVLVDCDNHLIDALRYAQEGLMRAAKATEKTAGSHAAKPIVSRWS